MSKELFVSSTPHETKVAVVEDDQLSEIYYERENEYTLAGSIYKGRVTRVLPGMQSAFVNIGLERDAFLYVSDFLLEEDDVEGLDQVVARGRIIESPSQEGAADERPPESPGPLEADEMIPPREAVAEHPPAEPRTREVESVEPPSENPQGEEQEREGARKWRGRRRRRGGRGRFHNDAREERGGEQERERPADQPSQRAPVGEEAEQPRIERAERSPAEHAPIVLPGESISKYQPRKTKAAEPKPAPVKTARPSTEYSFEPSAFSPDSMVLPGESISKYRGQSRPAPHAVAAQAPVKARPHEAELGVRQDEESAGPMPRGFEHVEEPRLAEEHTPEHEREEEEEIPETHRVQGAAPAAFSVPAAAESEAADKTGSVTETGQRRFQDRDTRVADQLEAVEETVEESLEEPAPEHETGRPMETSAEKPTAEPQPWQASGSGVVEEEEIAEEEEVELPGFEEDADLAEFEELEEEVLGSG